jgi:hypothetical protein
MYWPPSIPPAAAVVVPVAAAPPALHRPLSQRDHSVLAADVAAAAPFTPPQLSLRQRFSRSTPMPSLLPPCRRRRHIRAANAAASVSLTVHSCAGQDDHRVLAADVDAAAPSTPPQPPLRRHCSRSAPAPTLLRRRQRCRIRAANAAASVSSAVHFGCSPNAIIAFLPLTLPQPRRLLRRSCRSADVSAEVRQRRRCFLLAANVAASAPPTPLHQYLQRCVVARAKRTIEYLPLTLTQPRRQRHRSHHSADVAVGARQRQRCFVAANVAASVPPMPLHQYRWRCITRAGCQDDHQVLIADVVAAAPSKPPQPPLRGRCSICSAN